MDDEWSLRDLIRYYTKEAGVRGLEREIAKLARKVVKEQALVWSAKKKGRSRAVVEISADDVEHYNGVRKYTYGLAEEKNQVGIVTGLAWTQVGGELLNIEAGSRAGQRPADQDRHRSATSCRNLFRRRTDYSFAVARKFSASQKIFMNEMGSAHPRA